ncbi:MFS transporter [Streptomyces spiralis]|uniref:MFS transporter n=1 Tax=Streptomyces spiralis TaxID=66376 RepID=A0A919AEB0_9ACTN|nr:MFS transporter [Streptomyces spiralis]GHF00493.1 MFS transporter [Streptomyces spiralis]
MNEPESDVVASARSEAGGAARPFSWRFTAPLLIGSALNPINSSLIATALVPIAAGLHVRVGQTTALVTALYLASAIAQPTAGKAAQVFGPRRVFLTGSVLVAAGGTVGGLAQDLITLLISRVLIGLGTSCAYPTAMLLIRRRAHDAGLDEPPGNVLGALQIAGTATASLGLPVGGVLVGALTWRSVFFLNVPVALIALTATLAWIPRDNPVGRDHTFRGIASALDVTGILGFGTTMTALLVFLYDLPVEHWYLLGIAAAAGAALALWELRAAAPFLDVRLLAANRALTRTYLRFGLAMLCVYIVLYGLTQWAEAARGLSESASGLLLLPMTLVSAVVISPVSRRNLIRGPLIAAALMCVAGSAGVLLLTSSTWIGLFVAITVVFGISMGAASAGNQTALYDQAPAQQLGSASGLLRTFVYMGSIASSAITGIVFHTHVTDHGLHQIAWIMVGISAALIIMTIADRSLSLRPRR